jgi:hypothetical protein
MIRSKAGKYSNFVIDINKGYTITLRLILYALFEWYNIHKSNEIDLRNFLAWFKLNRNYTRYLIYVYISIDHG